MKHTDNNSYSEHQELSQLLPWYVNKTLQGAELKAVENHLTVCLTCKRELIQLHKLAQIVVQNGALDSAEQASFSRLKMRLHSDQPLDLKSLPQQARPEQHNTNNNVKQFGAKKPVWTKAISQSTLAMAAAVLLSLTVLMPRYVENDLQGNAFRTLSDAQPEAMKANEIRVVFAENVNQEQKNKVLERVHGQLIGDNPTAQGVYTVRLDKDIATKHLLDAIDLLRKDTHVIFAEPAYALLSSTHVEE